MNICRRFLLIGVLVLTASPLSAQWYIARYSGAGGTTTDDSNNLMANVLPSASGTYNLLDFTDPDDQGSPSNFSLNHAVPGNVAGSDDNYALSGSGILNVTTPGSYIFRSSADDGSRITLNGRNIVSTGGACCGNVNSAPINLAAGRYTINYSYKEGGGGSHGELAVSSDGGATFNLLGRGTDGAFTAAPGMFVDQSGPTRHAPLTSNYALLVTPGAQGLRGEYYNVSHANQNASVDAFFATNPTPTGTFVSTSPNYNTGATSVASHLGADGASLTAGGGNGTDNSTFRFQGFLEVRSNDDFDPSQPGIQVNFRVGSDDNSRIKIGGLTIAENDGSHGFPHYSTDNIAELAANTGDNAVGTQTLTFADPGFYALDAFYYNGDGGLALSIFSSIGAGGPTFPLVNLPSDRLFQTVATLALPEPSTIAIWTIAGVGLVAGAWLRRKRN